MFSKLWRLMPPREQKIKEPRIFTASIVLDEVNNNTCIVYSTNTTVLEYIVKLHNKRILEEKAKVTK